MRKSAMVIALALAGGCAKAPPVPADRFYRLADPVVAAGPALAQDALLVRQFRGDGVVSERALAYTETATGTSLEQHHYHFWADAPPRLLQQQMVAFLRNAAAAPIVTDDLEVDAGLVVTGRIRRFERKLAGEPGVRVALELRLDDRRGQPLLVRDYVAEEPAAGASFEDAVAAFDTAVGSIFTGFLADARAVVAAPR